MMYLIIGAYLIAVAVKESGLGERIAYKFIVKYVSSFKKYYRFYLCSDVHSGLIDSASLAARFSHYVGHGCCGKSADIPREDAVKIGFTVFTASIPVSMIFLTGDASINPLAAASCDPEPVGWLKWFEVMGLPMIVTSIITMVMILFMFKPTKEVNVNKTEILEKLEAMGPMSGKELRTAVWVTLAIILWMTDTLHGIDIGWVTLFIAMGMAMPKIGGILTPQSWSGVPVQTLIFFDSCCRYWPCGRCYRHEYMDSANCIAKQCAGKYVHPGRIYYSRFYCYPYAVRQRYRSYGGALSRRCWPLRAQWVSVRSFLL